MSTESWDAIHKEREWGTCPEPAMARFAMRRFGQLEDRGSVHILDVGCGAGAQTVWLASQGFFVTGIDSSEAAVARTGLRFDRLGLSGPTNWLICRPATNLAWPVGAPFDAVIDVCCLQHVQDIDQALSEIARVLKPGGWLFSMTAADDHSEEALGVMWTRRLDGRAVTELYDGPWSLMNLERATHTDRGRLVAHWLIEARKAP